MKLLKVNPDNIDLSIIRTCADIIRNCGVISAPTDTGYLLGVNGLNESAIKKIFDIKGRSFNNPIHITVHNIESARELAIFNHNAEILAKKFLPGALTLVLAKKDIVPDILTANTGKVGIRIPNNKIILALANEAKVPITSTSANISGKDTPFSASEVMELLGDKVDLVDIIIDGGEIQRGKTSTIVDTTTDPPTIIREGRIEKELIFEALK